LSISVESESSFSGLKSDGGLMAVQENVTAARVKERRARRSWSKQTCRQIVEETLKPGASVSLVARAHDVNTNQVFKWRKLYREGRLDTVPKASSTLLPVKISDSLATIRPAAKRRRAKARRAGIIDIDLGHARVRIEGTADPDCVRATLEGLMR
jgi:transposase